jgi:hypothetical protein
MLEHRLESLMVNESPLAIPQIVPVARFLSAIFPGLQRLYQSDWKFVRIAEEETPYKLRRGDGEIAGKKRRIWFAVLASIPSAASCSF